MARILGIGSRINHKEHGKGVLIETTSDAYGVAFIDHGILYIEKTFDDFDVIEQITPTDAMTVIEEVEKRLRNVIRDISDIQETVKISEKWRGGTLVLKPGNTELKSYEIPIETFFHKIVMIRDRVRVMEQRINNSALDEDEKIDLQQYITRIYGSLTSFNILFRDRRDDFTGIRKQ